MNKKVKTVSRCLASLVAVLSISTASMFAEKNYKIVERMQLSYHLHEGAYFDDDSYTKPYLNTEIVEEGNKIRVYVDFNHKKLPAKISNGHLIVGDYKYEGGRLSLISRNNLDFPARLMTSFGKHFLVYSDSNYALFSYEDSGVSPILSG